MRVPAPPACNVAQSVLLGVHVPKHWGVAVFVGSVLTVINGLTIVDAAGNAGSVETSTLNWVLQGAGLFNVLAPDAPSSLYRGPVHTRKMAMLPPSFKKSCVYMVTLLFTVMSFDVSLSSISTTESPPFSPLGHDVGSVVALLPSTHW